MNGVVRLRVEGLMLERLIGRALKEGARFDRIARNGPRTWIIDAPPDSAAILSALCERFSISCQELSRRGQDAMLRRLKKRATLLAGVLVCLCCVSLFLSRVWLIDVELTNGRPGDIQALEEALAALDVAPGMSKADLNADLLQERLVASSPDYSFIGVRLQGVRLLVEASPAVAEPELYALSGARDLVAACDGVVLSVNVQSGVACVQPGETVVRGQVLIRGEERVSKEETRGISALGTVVARTWHEGFASAPTQRTEALRTGRRATSSEIRMMAFAWPLVEGEAYASQEVETEILPIGGLYLPLEIYRTTAHETRLRTTACSEEALRDALADLAFAAAAIELSRSQPADCKIADRWIEYIRDPSGLLTARAVYEAHTDIAVSRDALYQ